MFNVCILSKVNDICDINDHQVQGAAAPVQEPTVEISLKEIYRDPIHLYLTYTMSCGDTHSYTD